MVLITEGLGSNCEPALVAAVGTIRSVYASIHEGKEKKNQKKKASKKTP
jgi:hypothetical protein